MTDENIDVAKLAKQEEQKQKKRDRERARYARKKAMKDNLEPVITPDFPTEGDTIAEDPVDELDMDTLVKLIDERIKAHNKDNVTITKNDVTDILKKQGNENSGILNMPSSQFQSIISSLVLGTLPILLRMLSGSLQKQDQQQPGSLAGLSQWQSQTL